jgi:hypothetical protein
MDTLMTATAFWHPTVACNPVYGLRIRLWEEKAAKRCEQEDRLGTDVLNKH